MNTSQHIDVALVFPSLGNGVLQSRQGCPGSFIGGGKKNLAFHHGTQVSNLLAVEATGLIPIQGGQQVHRSILGHPGLGEGNARHLLDAGDRGYRGGIVV